MALASLLVGLACAPREAPEPTRHVLLMGMDTVRYDAWELVRRHAPPPAGSPWQRAIHLTRVQSTAPWTLPAVSSVFTGLHPSHHGAGLFQAPIADFRRERAATLAPEAVTLAERLRLAGFATMSFTASGMFHWAGFDQGFEQQRFLGGSDSRLAIEREARFWLDRRERERPQTRFFLYLHFMEAHMSPRSLAADVRAARLAHMPPALIEAARAGAPARACAHAGETCERWLEYVAAVLAVRDTVTNILVDLEHRGLLDRTAIALYSDHGEEFRDHEELARSRGLDPRGAYGQGHGHTLFQELLHVPVVLWHPALPGRDAALPASLADLAPTLLAWAGQPVPPGDGLPLGPALAGGAYDAGRPLYSSAVAYGPARESVLRAGRKRVSGGGRAPDLVFDLERDPQEQHPAPKDAEDLAALLREYREGAAPARAPDAIDRATLRELQALGYLEAAEPDPPPPTP